MLIYFGETFLMEVSLLLFSNSVLLFCLDFSFGRDLRDLEAEIFGVQTVSDLWWLAIGVPVVLAM